MTIVLFTCKNFADKISYAYMMHSISTYTKKTKNVKQIILRAYSGGPYFGFSFFNANVLVKT